MISSKELSDELGMLTRRAGIVVPEERMATLLASYADLRDQIALLHNRYAHTDEPANVFRLSPDDV